MKSTSCRTSGTVVAAGASALFFGFQWTFAILEPSGKCVPLPGTPAREASIIMGLARITAINSSVWLTATTCQSSYPLNSENASPFGTCTVYLSCADMALPPKTASATTTIAISQDGIFVMLVAPLRFSDNVELFDRCQRGPRHIAAKFGHTRNACIIRPGNPE